MTDLAWLNKKIQQHSKEDPSVKAVLQFQLSTEKDTILMDDLKEAAHQAIHKEFANWETRSPDSNLFVSKSLLKYEHKKNETHTVFWLLAQQHPRVTIDWFLFEIN